MNFLVDLVLLLLIVGFAVAGFKKGFVKTLITGFKNIAAFAVAWMFSSRLGEWLKDQFFMERAREAIEKKLAEFLGTGNLDTTDMTPLLDAEHSGFVQFLEKMGIDIESINELFRNGDGSVNEAVGEYIAEPCVNALSSVLAFVLLFVGTLIVIAIVGAILGLVVKLPILKGTNRLLGGVLGLVIGVFWAFIVTALIRIVVPYFADNALVSSLGEGGPIYSFISSVAPTFLSSIL
ncbi:MAG: CvpA family protein [Clostridia bacterium]|nr:CvpA family protein [Clostridia bacterium]